MVLWVPPTFGGVGDTNLASGSRLGTTVTASGTAHVKGAWSSLIDPTGKPSFGIWIRLKGVATTNANTSMLVDIGYGQTGGGNEQVLIPNLNAGAAPGAFESGKFWYFPIFIPTGTRGSARCQAVIVSDTVQVAVMLDQDPKYKVSYGSVQDYGTDTANSRGTSVPPGSASFGAWTQIGAGTDPVRRHRFWTIGYDSLGDTSIANADVFMEFGIGPDSGNLSVVGRFMFSQNSAESCGLTFPLFVYADVNVAEELWVRIASAETENRGIILYGMD